MRDDKLKASSVKLQASGLLFARKWVFIFDLGSQNSPADGFEHVFKDKTMEWQYAIPI